MKDNLLQNQYFYGYTYDADNQLIMVSDWKNGKSDALHIELSNGQDIFLDPGFLGINIGGLDVKQVWEENLLDGVLPEEICIEFDYK